MTLRRGMRNTNLQFNKVKRTLERNKTNQYSNVPRTILELQKEFEKPDVLNKYGFSYEGDAKFYIGTVVLPNHAFTVFASQFVIDFVQKNIASRKYVMDGTFGSIPKQFYQLLTITLEHKNNVSSYSACIFPVKTSFCPSV